MTKSPASTNEARSRFRPDPSSGFRLTERDKEVLHELYLSRLLTRDNLIGLGLFGSVPRANAILRRLYDHGYVRRYFPALCRNGAQATYHLGPAAIDLVVVATGDSREEVARQCRADFGRLHVDHTLRVNDIRLSFRSAAMSANAEFRWTSEGHARNEYRLAIRGRWERRILKPDAFLTVGRKGRRSAFFLEADLGHVSRGQWQKTVEGYANHSAAGLVREAYGVESATVLVVTAGKSLRVRHLASPAAKVRCPRFLVTTFELVGADPFGVIWKDPADTDGDALVALPMPEARP